MIKRPSGRYLLEDCMDFPRYVFTSPGPEKVKEGSYGTRLVSDENEYESAIKAGFCFTMMEAINGDKGGTGKEGKPEAETEETNKRRGRPSKI